MKSKYKAVLFARDGDWVTDCRGETIDEVSDKLDDLGSRWYFYPLPMIIKDHGNFVTSRQRVIHTYYDQFKSKSISNVSKMIANMSDDEFTNLFY